VNAPQLTPTQQAAVFFPLDTFTGDALPVPFRHLVIEAGAGAGKTTLLTERVNWRLNSAPRNQRIEAQDLILVTFSRAADEELRTRVEKRISRSGLSQEASERILGRLHISTIDSLFMQLSNNLFPTWWEEKRSSLPESTLEEWGLAQQHFPPAVTLVSEDELYPELAEQLLGVLKTAAQDPEREIALLDFILAGAFEASSFSGSGKSGGPHQSLRRILSAMLHENLLREDAPPLQFALEKIHPSSLSALESLKTLARRHFYRRLMQGRMTHNDRMLFLHHLLVAQKDLATESFFKVPTQPHLPVQCKELIVDEYQDTNEIQHNILTSMLHPTEGRMVVVGDPKQSIYGFRSAHVGVFQRLKSDPRWKLIELTQNFRSHPELLPWINYLSDLSFSYKNNRIPEQFLGTTFSLAAQQTYVESKSLDAGRSTESSKSSAPYPRVLLLGASLSKERSELGTIPPGHDQHSFTCWALARELRLLTEQKGFAWKDIVVLCETNDLALKTHQHFKKLGLPSIAKTTRFAEKDAAYQLRCEELGLLLAKWLCEPLDTLEFAQLIWNGWIELSLSDASLLLSQASQGMLGAEFIDSPNTQKQSEPSRDNLVFPQAWIDLRSHLISCRALAERHFFSAWQVFRWGLDGSDAQHRKDMNFEMESVASALHQTLEIWSVRKTLEQSAAQLHNRSTQSIQQTNGHSSGIPPAARVWPHELLQNKLRQFRLNAAQSDPNQDAISVCTIHGAKGLEWPVVVFWPSSKRERAPENFVMKSGDEATQIKWLAEDTQSASLLPWIANPTPPKDIVSISVEGSSGEQSVRWSADLQDRLEQDFERQRVFYTAYTRAREMLILVSPAATGRTMKNLRDKLSGLKEGDEFDPLKLKLNSLESTVMALFADTFFDLRKEGKRGSRPKTPWLGRAQSAAVRHEDWKDILALRDYGPDWLADVSFNLNVAVGFEDNENVLHLDQEWREAWAESRFLRARTTPWKIQSAESQLELLQPPIEGRTEPAATHADEKKSATADSNVENLAPHEAGLRFHALMEHSGSVLPPERSFLSKLLSRVIVREHELELWGGFDTPTNDLAASNGLFRTQRRILDLFCVIPSAKWPKELWQVPCIQPESQITTPLQKQLEDSLKADPNLHLVVDFKTGRFDPEHLIQMRQYLKWIKHILTTQPALLVSGLAAQTLFSGDDKPLVGILYYTAANFADAQNFFASSRVNVDKNTSLLFVSPE
jgi:ATP-dependent exoDNAse (exonuclease V) beta subunit